MPGGRGLIQINDSVQELAQHNQRLSEAKCGRVMITSILVPADGAERVGEEVVIVVVETGDPAGRIAERAQANSVELIVMGRCGSGDLAGLLSAKVAQVASFARMTVK